MISPLKLSDETITCRQSFKSGVQCLTRGILLQKCICQMSVYINKVRLPLSKASEFVDVTRLTDFTSIVCIKQFFKLPGNGPNQYPEIRNAPGYRSLQSVICRSFSESVKRMEHNLKSIKVVRLCIKPSRSE